MITICEDPHQYSEPPDHVLLAATIADYVPVRMRIRQAIDQHQSLMVLVVHPTLLHWFSDLRSYPEHVVCWQVVDPTQEFTIIFGETPPPLFTPALIAALDPASLTPPPPGKTVDPVAWILGQRLHDLWGYHDLYEEHIVDLVAYLAQQSVPPPEQLRPLIQEQLRHWAAVHPAYQSLRPAALHADSTRLLLRWALQRYALNWLQEQGLAHLPLIDARGQEAICIELLRACDGVIRAYWSQTFARTDLTGDAVMAALVQMSGLSEAELHALITVLERHPDLLNERLLTAIQKHFSHLPAVDSVVRDLSPQVPPATPVLPDEQWTTTQWLHWATQEYLPYFAWVVRANQPRDHQHACALAFSDWLAEQYPAWLNQEDSPLLLHQFPRMRQILTDDAHAVVVWLVVDGLTWWQGQFLREACEQHEMYPQAHTPGIAALPSITSVSKRMLITGLPATEPTTRPLAQVAREHFTRSGIHGVVCSNLADAANTLQHDPNVRCVLVLFNMIDTVAHQMTTFTDDEGIRGYLRSLAAQLARMMRHGTSRGQSFHALIGSDHGSTLLPPDATIQPLPHAGREIEDLWEADSTVQPQPRSTRAAIVTDPQRLPHLDSMAWYTLEQQRYQLDNQYIVPRGYQYIKRRPTGWTHGGLTPEEVIVPLLHLTSQQVSVQPLVVELQGALRAAQASTLTMAIVNPNPFPLDAVVVQVKGSVQPVTIAQIAPSSQQQAEVQMTAMTSQASEISVSWVLRCTSVSGAYAQEGHQTLSVRRLQTTDTSLDDLFDL
jgi:hypothetical protein